MAGWGTFFGKIADWIPGRAESRRNRIIRIKKELDEILKHSPFTTRDADAYMYLSEQLRDIQEQAAND